MNLTPIFSYNYDKLVIGPHLPLSPARTAVKPEEHDFAHHPNPIQEGVSQCSKQKSSVEVFLGSVEEQRLDT